MINLHHLHYFYVCAQQGGVTKAARTLGISQPSLSTQIKNFEQQIGFPLFSRTSRTFSLTAQGRDLFTYAARVFSVTDEIGRYLNMSEISTELFFRIGVSDDIERPFMADVVGRLLKQSTAVKLQAAILSKSHEAILEMLDQDQIDLMITNKKISHLKMITSFELPVGLVSSTPSPLFSGNLSQVGGLILPSPEMILGKETRSYLKKNGIKSKILIESNILACVVRSVQEGVGAAFLPVIYIQKEIEKGTLYRYGPKSGFWKHKIYLYTQKNKSLALAENVTQIIRDLAAI